MNVPPKSVYKSRSVKLKVGSASQGPEERRDEEDFTAV